MASLNFETEREAFLTYYGANEILLRDAAGSFATLVQLLLSDGESFETPSVESRVKDRNECISKFKRKYQAECEKQKAAYEIRPFITDLIGIRVVCLYEPELQSMAAVLTAHFDVLGQADKGQEKDLQESEFGYKALHLDLRLNSARSGLPEYRRFIDLQFEVQIRTAIQDAWSTLDHRIKYKRSIPTPLKRRINRLAALFELADQEFLFIRNETKNLEAEARTVAARSAAVEEKELKLSTQIRSPHPVRLNAAEFIAICSELAPGYPFDPMKADGFVQEIWMLRPDLTATEFKEIIARHRSVVESYRTFQTERMHVRMNPYTIVRHILYLDDKQVYRECLFDRQRTTFDNWLAEHGVK